MIRIALPLAAAVALVGCKTEPEPEPVGARFDLLDPVGLEMTGDVGVDAAALVRTVNEWGVPVPSDDLTIRLDGVDTPVEIDGFGYGRGAPTAPGSYVASVEGASPVEVHRTAQDWPGMGLMPASFGVPDAVRALPATDGALVTTDTEVFWVDYDGATHRVLAMPAGTTIDGARTAHLDADGVLDALVWGGERVVMLRGRYGGGMTWGAGLTASDMVPAGAAASDLDNDGLPDVVVSWRGETTSAVEVWHGDGLWGFTPAPALRLTSMPTDVAVGDNTGEGREQITQVIEAGTWQRFVISVNGRYAGTGPDLVLDFPEGTTVESGWDFNGDGGDEIWILGPRNPGQNRDVIYYDLVGQQTNYLRLTPLAAHVGFGDGDGDGLVDAFMLHETLELFELTFNGGTNAQRRIATLGEHAPISVRDASGDGVPEVLLAGDTWARWYTGGALLGDENTTWWQVTEPATVVEDIDADPFLAPAELDDDDTTTEVVGFSTSGQNLFLKVWSIAEGDEPAATELDAFQLSSTGGEVVDFAVCDRDFFVATDENVYYVRMGTNGILWQPATPRALVADAIDCGAAPGGATVAILVGNTIHLVGDDLADVQTRPANGAADLAIVDFGAPNLSTCDTAGCQVITVDYGPAGEQVAVTSDATGLHADDGTDQWDVASGSGVITAADVDGDGTEDLIALDAQGAVIVFRSTGEGFGVPEVFHTQRVGAGVPIAADVTGDGAADLLTVDANADLVMTLTPGYVPAAR